MYEALMRTAPSHVPAARESRFSGLAPRGASSRRHPASARPAAAGRGSGDAADAHAAAAATAAGRNAQREVAVLGGEDFILSQRSGVSEELFKGAVLGVDADAASVDFRQTHLRSLRHVPADLEPPPRFLERVAVHFARNVLAGGGQMPRQVPLIMGIWGPKGVGKTFTLELCLAKMGVAPVCLSAGELEDEWAGEPGRRLRDRYSFAARQADATGQPTALVISDLDAGVGTFGHTFNTVNTQNLQGALMSLCDDPLSVSTGQAWSALKPRVRVPIYVTANDLTCLYAPLVREGRMDKFLYEPTRDEMAVALCALFAPGLGPSAVDALLDAFPAQPMDFFGAIKARLADAGVRRWLQDAAAAEGAVAALHGLVAVDGSGRSTAGVVPEGSLEAALSAGAELAGEQQAVLDVRLALEYTKGLADSIQHAEERSGQWAQQKRAREAGRVAGAEAAEAVRRAAAEVVLAKAAAGRAARAAEHAAAGGGAAWDAAAQQGAAPAASAWQEEAEAEAAPAPAPAPTPSGLPGVTPDDLAAELAAKRVVALDVRGAREWDWGRIKGAAHSPYVLTKGSALAPETVRNPDFLAAAQKALGPPGAARPAVLYGPGADLTQDASASFVSKELFVSIAPSGSGVVDGEDIVAAAARTLTEAGYTQLSELAGGYRSWDMSYRPDGRRRGKGAFRDKSSGDLEWWTASN